MSCSCGLLVSYTRIEDAPFSSAISRIGTRTPRGPSTYTFRELGNAVENSDIPHSLRRFEPGPPSVRRDPAERFARRRVRFQGSVLNPVDWDTPGGQSRL